MVDVRARPLEAAAVGAHRLVMMMPFVKDCRSLCLIVRERCCVGLQKIRAMITKENPSVGTTAIFSRAAAIGLCLAIEPRWIVILAPRPMGRQTIGTKISLVTLELNHAML